LRWRFAFAPRSKGEMNLAIHWCLGDSQIIAIAADRWMKI
jgi:hypothetical protein